MPLYATPISAQTAIYIGICVDDFVYYSESDQVEHWFKTGLADHFKVNFMGPILYFLDCHYVWYRTRHGLAVHISQPGFAEVLPDRFNMSDCNPVKTPYRSGHVIDLIPQDI